MTTTLLKTSFQVLLECVMRVETVDFSTLSNRKEKGQTMNRRFRRVMCRAALFKNKPQRNDNPHVECLALYIHTCVSTPCHKADVEKCNSEEIGHVRHGIHCAGRPRFGCRANRPRLWGKEDAWGCMSRSREGIDHGEDAEEMPLMCVER